MGISHFYASLEDRYDSLSERKVLQLTVMLPGAGCAWAKRSGGCYMCGFSRSTYRYTRGRLLPTLVFKAMLSKAMAGVTAEIVAIYNGGSFLNPREIPASIPAWLSEKVAKHPSIRQLFVESRPEFVDSTLIQAMITSLGGKILKVGIGLECVTDIIRERCIHKGFSLEDYKRAVNVLRDHGARVLTYVFFKPVFLSEAEAIEEAVKTIDYAFSHGSDEVALESAFVQKGTLMHRMFQNGKFRPPWLWSVIEVVKRTQHLGLVHIAGFSDEPPPIAIPTNCPNCSPQVEKALQDFRETADIRIFEGLDCTCLEQWREECNRVLPPLEERLVVSTISGARV